MIVGIGGASTSGKSNLANAIQEELKHFSIKILPQDEFVYPLKEIPLVNELTDWECPESINFSAYISTITQASIDHDIVIAEGLLVFHYNELNSLFNKRLFIEIDRSTFISRKQLDDRWGKIPAWYIDHIWESYQKLGTVDSGNPGNLLVIDGSNNINIQSIVEFLDLDTSSNE